MSAVAWKRFHLGLIAAWALLIPASYLTRWIYEVWFVNLLSLVALILASLAGWQAAHSGAKVEQAQEVNADEVKVQRADEVTR